ncbi:unnamed protein product [Candida verbasci]|uniref:Uncharacterized protein n=1 Tax=Candida verbasci TaxID=1227364 RepID=A0A9W4XD24_9ASCO|nr:unnamed protein product [Candida verbasci]
MIRGQWSLSQEFKQNEKRQQNRIQQKQKHEFMMKKLSKIDPIKLFYKIENLEKKENKSKTDEHHLNLLKDDWEFIEKNKLHLKKLEKLKKELETKERLKLKQKSKLWGDKSVYFNPELNALGKVPNGYKNLTIPLKERVKYEPDPLIKQLNIKLPTGSPPQFYKLIQNTSKSMKSEEPEQKKIKLSDPS